MSFGHNTQDVDYNTHRLLPLHLGAEQKTAASPYNTKHHHQALLLMSVLYVAFLTGSLLLQ